MVGPRAQRGVALCACGAALACSTPEPTTPCVPDVVGAFATLADEPAPGALAPGEVFDDDPWAYTFTTENDLGYHNHFQGITRVGEHWLVTGGDRKNGRADLFVADDGAMLARLRLDSGTEWHAGGIDALDGVLAVATEELGGGPATLRLLDVRDPLAPVELLAIAREEGSKAHAAGIARAGDGMVLASWDDQRLELYFGADFAFDAAPAVTLDAADVVVEVAEQGSPGVNGQSVSLLAQCDGGLYAAMNDNTSDLPFDGGTSFLDLYRVDLDPPALVKVGSRVVRCPPDQGCNLRAAAGVWVDGEGALHLVATAFFRDATGALPYAEF